MNWKTIICVMTKRFIIVFSSGNRIVKLDAIEGETVRDFTLRVIQITDLPVSFDDTFLFMIYNENTLINTFLNRHEMLLDIIKPIPIVELKGCVFHFTILAHFERRTKSILPLVDLLGNLKDTRCTPSITESQCGICLESNDFSSAENVVIPLINCGHHCHAKCILRVNKFECPTCGTPISAYTLPFVELLIKHVASFGVSR